MHRVITYASQDSDQISIEHMAVINRPNDFLSAFTTAMMDPWSTRYYHLMHLHVQTYPLQLSPINSAPLRCHVVAQVQIPARQHPDLCAQERTRGKIDPAVQTHKDNGCVSDGSIRMTRPLANSSQHYQIRTSCKRLPYGRKAAVASRNIDNLGDDVRIVAKRSYYLIVGFPVAKGCYS